jgi:aspartyl-tRNA(Asn)/glutamyl-tRNA(Gln) amidotransferase subunit C
MSLSDELLDRLAFLCQLDLRGDERARARDDLAALIGLVGEIAAVPTAGVEPLAQPLDQVMRLRPDAVTEAVDRERLQRGAPAVEAGLYLVPRVVD